MFDKILIANRGEIACRIMQTAKTLGVKTVAVYSDADANARHVKMADEAIHIGPAPSRDSYLVAERVIAAAKQTGAQAIHPGYGFLSENAEFCRLCEQENIVFIGPPVSAIEAMGSKSAAKNIMAKAKVPLVPGYHGDDQSLAVIKQAADDMGYPVLLKATAGGGGKGMRQVWHSDEFAEGFAAVKREALSSFGDDTMLVEKYLTKPRHVEIQVFCDSHGNAVYLFERDCSVQRRHQKVIEEAPAFAMTETLRQQMGEAAIKSAQAIGYVGAGTVEFLLNPDLKNIDNSDFYFMEMNTRLQVEHPVTEMITGEDLVEWQLKVAYGEKLPKSQQQLKMHGHSFEARIYAEDPNNEFLPSTGKLTYLQPPAQSKHVRVDTGVEQGDEVSVFYDPMIAKLIVWDENRELALKRLKQALRQYRIYGVTTNIEFLYNVANAPSFQNEDIDTGFIDKNHEQLFAHNNNDQQEITTNLTKAALAYVVRKLNPATDNSEHCQTIMPRALQQSPWQNNNAFRLNQNNRYRLKLLHLDGDNTELTAAIDINLEVCKNNVFNVEINHPTWPKTIITHCQADLLNNELSTVINGYKSKVNLVFDDENVNPELNSAAPLITLFSDTGISRFLQVLPDLGDANNSEEQAGLTAPMNGTMIDVLVSPNDSVTKGQALVIIEAMKMEHTIRAPEDGTITAIFYAAGDMVDGGAELIGFEAQ